MTRTESADRITRAKKINIISFLKESGIDVSESGSYYRCLSPLHGESVPSFFISKRTGRWKDWGNGKRGDIIDLVREIHGIGLQDAVDKLLNDERCVDMPKFKPTKQDRDAIEIISVQDLKTLYLVAYLMGRKIPLGIAMQYLKELEIRFPYGKYPERVSRVLGFKNDSGGYEMRNKVLKVGNKPKNVTTIKGTESKGVINIYEGFFSFLSSQPRRVTTDTVVLNSLSFLPQMLSFWGTKYHINVMLDNDSAGDKAVEMIKQSGCSYTDLRYTYANYNDLNDLLCNKPIKAKKKFLNEILK